MQQLKPSTQKMILWLFSKAVENKGPLTYIDMVLPDLVITTDFDFALTNTEQPIVEFNIVEKGADTDHWKARILLVKVIGEELPKVYPQMYSDPQWGIKHVLRWIQDSEQEKPDLLSPIQPDFDLVCGIINSRIGDAWSRRKDKFPRLK